MGAIGNKKDKLKAFDNGGRGGGFFNFGGGGGGGSGGDGSNKGTLQVLFLLFCVGPLVQCSSTPSKPAAKAFSVARR